MKNYLLLFLSLALQVALFNSAALNWWAKKDHTLFEYGHWDFGKDEGKYVFMTYQFMFDELEENELVLNSYGGNQEIYWKKQHPNQPLEKLEFECWVPFNYLWVNLGQENSKRLGIRLSNHEYYASGFFEYDPSGSLVKHTPFFSGEDLGFQWHRISVEKVDGQIHVRMNGNLIGRIADKWSSGRFGFRGCEPGPEVKIRNVRMEFSNPESGEESVVWEKFARPAPETSVVWAILSFSMLGIGIRFLRNLLLMRAMPKENRARFMAGDAVSFVAIFLALAVLVNRPSVLLGNLIIFSELMFIILLLRGRPQMVWGKWKYRILIFGTIISLVMGYSALMNGEWLGRKRYKSTEEFAGKHPESFIKIPGTMKPSPPVTLENFSVRMSEPWFSEEDVWNEQVIKLHFTMEENATMHLVWNQQAFQTRGDADGEPLPLVRRLLQLTTRSDVDMGLSVYLERKPFPFLSIAGSIKPGALNVLEVRSDKDGIQLVLNGEETRIASKKPLGLGETGIMAYHAPVTIQSLQVSSTSSEANRAHLLPLLGFAFPLMIGLISWLIVRPFGKPHFKNCVALGFLASTWPAIYCLGAIYMGPKNFSYLGSERLGIFDIALICVLINVFCLIVLQRASLKRAFIPANVVGMLIGLSVLLLVYDRHLPANHPLKVKNNEQATPPAKIVEDWRIPYYTHNSKIGANLYVWKQAFEGKAVSVEKDPDRLRVFFTGGSQSWGSGAASSDSIYSELVEKTLQESGMAVDVTNAAINGAGIFQLAAWYEDILSYYKPDFLVADIGLNDSAGFYAAGNNVGGKIKAFKRLVEMCEANNCQLVWVKEPINGESALRPAGAIYDGFAGVCEAFGIPVCDPQPAFMERNRTHQYWWDSAHLTQSGQILLSKEIAPVLEELIHKQSAK